MSTFTTTLLYLLITATLQNVVLTIGIGTSAMLKIVRRPQLFLRFSVLLLFFSVVTAALFFPLDIALPTTWLMLMVRPAIIVVLAVILYCATTLFLSRFFKPTYQKVRSLLPLAALNNVAVGVTLLINHQASLDFFPALGIAAGAAIGFLLLCAITAEGISRIDNPDTPAAFRGLPATFVYLGLLSLALMAFAPSFNLL